MRFEFGFLGQRYACSLWLLIAYCCLTVLLCGLGFWQLERAGLKAEFLARRQAALETQDVVDLNREEAADVRELRYHLAKATGHYDAEHQFLLDNRMLDGQPGYDVLTPFKLSNGQAILVNRGWLPLGADRRVLPDVRLEQAIDQVRGRINRFPEVGWKLAGMEKPGAGWPALLQLAEPKALSEHLGYPVYDFQLELAPEMAGGYRREWRQPEVMPPERHIGYAVQWFGLAATLSVLFILKAIKKMGDRSE